MNKAIDISVIQIYNTLIESRGITMRHTRRCMSEDTWLGIMFIGMSLAIIAGFIIGHMA